jgi:hypothetical protein
MDTETNPFKKYPAVAPRVLLPTDAAQTARSWLLAGAVAEIKAALARHLEEYVANGLEVRVHQRGDHYIATGVDLPVLERRINEVMEARGVAPFDRVGYCLGLSLKEPTRRVSVPPEEEPDYGDFELGQDRTKGIYLGIRIQRSRPNGTVPQDVHELVFDGCRLALERTGCSEWRHRRSGFYWSIWRFLGPSSLMTASEAKAQYVDQLLDGLAALEGVGWDRAISQ